MHIKTDDHDFVCGRWFRYCHCRVQYRTRLIVVAWTYVANSDRTEPKDISTCEWIWCQCIDWKRQFYRGLSSLNCTKNKRAATDSLHISHYYRWRSQKWICANWSWKVEMCVYGDRHQRANICLLNIRRRWFNDWWTQIKRRKTNKFSTLAFDSLPKTVAVRFSRNIWL